MNKTYENVFSLDFELYNSKFYWSVCWAGVALADKKLNLTGEFDLIINPGLKERFVGNDMTFPFTSKDLAAYKTFDFYSGKLLNLIKPNTLIIGHAFENDIKMILDSCHKFGLKVPEFDYLDTNIIYNAVKDTQGEHSLKNLADEFGIEFNAHDPKEDARAALLIAKKCIGELSIGEFLIKFGVVPGGFKNNSVKKCYNASMSENKKQRVINFNKVYDCAAVMPYNKSGVAYYIDGAIASDCDTSALAKKLIENGCRLTASTYSADIVITNNLSLRGEEKYVPLKSMLIKLDIPFKNFDFAPHKVRDENGKAISLTDYYDRAYKDFKHDGEHSGKKFSFSKSSERRVDYESLIKKLITGGGTVHMQVNESDYFIVNKLSDLKSRNDGRVRAYLMSKKPKVLEFDSL